MHFGRMLTILGVVLAAVGFFLKSASSAGEAALAQLSQVDPSFPSGFDNTWTALYNDTPAAAIIFAIAAVGALAAALIPPLGSPMKRLYGLATAALGVLMLVIGIFATMGAMDDADTLEAGFAQAFAGGVIPEAYSVSIGWGWYLLVLGAVVVAIGGAVSLIARPDEDAVDFD